MVRRSSGGWAHEPWESTRAAAELVLALADAIAYAHARGVLHRDIKPSNVFLQPRDDQPPVEDTPSDAPNANDGGPKCSAVPQAELSAFTPKLGDFGLARFDDDATDETRSGVQLGTPASMAPEQIEGDRTKVDGRTDVYALGVLLYEMLTGQLPYHGETRAQILSQVLLCEPPRPRQLRRDLPRDLEAITLRCLEKRPDRRYPAAAALEEDLRRFLAGEPTNAQPRPLSGTTRQVGAAPPGDRAAAGRGDGRVAVGDGIDCP